MSVKYADFQGRTWRGDGEHAAEVRGQVLSSPNGPAEMDIVLRVPRYKFLYIRKFLRAVRRSDRIGFSAECRRDSSSWWYVQYRLTLHGSAHDLAHLLPQR